MSNLKSTIPMLKVSDLKLALGQLKQALKENTHQWEKSRKEVITIQARLRRVPDVNHTPSHVQALKEAVDYLTEQGIMGIGIVQQYTRPIKEKR